MGRITSYNQNGRMVADFDKSAYDLMACSRLVDIGGIEVVSTGSRLLTAEDAAKVTTHVERLETENAKLKALCEWLLEPYRLGAITGEGVDKRWCRETYDGGSYRLRELGVDE